MPQEKIVMLPFDSFQDSVENFAFEANAFVKQDTKDELLAKTTTKELPPEIWVEILRQLTLEDLGQMARVNKLFRSILGGVNYCFPNIKDEFFPYQSALHKAFLKANLNMLHNSSYLGLFLLDNVEKNLVPEFLITIDPTVFYQQDPSSLSKTSISKNDYYKLDGLHAIFSIYLDMRFKFSRKKIVKQNMETNDNDSESEIINFWSGEFALTQFEYLNFLYRDKNHIIEDEVSLRGYQRYSHRLSPYIFDYVLAKLLAEAKFLAINFPNLPKKMYDKNFYWEDFQASSAASILDDWSRMLRYFITCKSFEALLNKFVLLEYIKNGCLSDMQSSERLTGYSIFAVDRCKDFIFKLTLLSHLKIIDVIRHLKEPTVSCMDDVNPNGVQLVSTNDVDPNEIQYVSLDDFYAGFVPDEVQLISTNDVDPDGVQYVSIDDFEDEFDVKDKHSDARIKYESTLLEQKENLKVIDYLLDTLNADDLEFYLGNDRTKRLDKPFVYDRLYDYAGISWVYSAIVQQHQPIITKLLTELYLLKGIKAIVRDKNFQILFLIDELVSQPQLLLEVLLKKETLLDALLINSQLALAKHFKDKFLDDYSSEELTKHLANLKTLCNVLQA